MALLLSILRRNKVFFLLAAAAALALRFFFIAKFRVVDGDTFVYGDIALNWVRHGVFGITHKGIAEPTLIRLPGYPAFLVVVFSIAGAEHYNAVLIAQAF